MVVAGDRPLPALLQERAFWDSYVWGGPEDRPEGFDRYNVKMRVSGRCTLLIDVWFEDYLYLLHPDLPEPGYLGWLNDYHCWHPYALRWEELDVISHCIALRSGLPHPGIPLILLAGFSWPDPDQRSEAFVMLRRAFDTLGLFDVGAIDDLIARFGFRDEFTATVTEGPSGGPLVQRSFTYTLDRRWGHDKRLGLVMEGHDGYSLRRREYDEFPFGHLDALVRAALATVRSDQGVDSG
jgi:hypothetical protein